jgi:hypothetical protein
VTITKKPMFIVQLVVDADVEDRWNEWYNAVHLPEVMAASRGILSATRYRQTGGTGTYTYCAVYEFEDDLAMKEFMESDRLAAMSAQYNLDWAGKSSRINHFYVPFVQR